jgi:phytanoyl-CoA hydroxylase
MTVSVDRKRFEKQGFLHLRGVLAPEDLTPLRVEFGALLSERADGWRAAGTIVGGEHLRDLPFEEHLIKLATTSGLAAQLLGELDITLPHAPFSAISADSPFHIGPGLVSLLSNGRLLDVVQSIVGPDIAASPNQHCRIKLPNAADEATPWHRDAMTQDVASDDVTVLTAWIPMHDVPEESGCLAIVPGGHTAPYPINWPVDPGVRKRLQEAAVAVPVCTGDIILLHKQVPHASLPNRSKRIRWSFDLRFFPAGSPSDRPWFPDLVVRHAGVPTNPEADSWRRRWCEVRDQFARTQLPVPGRPEYARMIAEAHIRRWEADNYTSV